MTTKQIIDELKSTMKSGSVAELNDSLKTLMKISNFQLSANRSYIQSQMSNLIAAIAQNLKNNEKIVVNNQQTPLLLKRFSDWIPEFSKQYKSDVFRLLRQTKKQMIEDATQQMIQKQLQKYQNKIIADVLNDKPQVINFSQPKINFDPFKQTAIQRSIQPLNGILSNQIVPNQVNQSQLPKSIRYLAKYAQLQGKIPIGQISQFPGQAYIGIRRIKDGQRQYKVPYQKNPIPYSNAPNIANRFQYHANQTINSWNQFVKHQAQFVDFVKKVATKEARIQYTQNQLNQLNMCTFNAQSLATLTFYYVLIPLQKYARYRQGKQFTQQNFLQNYQVANSPSKNPLLLKSDQGKQICQKLFTVGQPSTVLAQIMKSLKNFQNSINRKRMEQFKNHVLQKQLEAKAYCTSAGVNQAQTANLLIVKNIDSIKTRKFVLPTMFQNNQIVSIIQKVTNKNKQNNKQSSLWQLNWGSQKMMCHDYIWNYNIE